MYQHVYHHTYAGEPALSGVVIMFVVLERPERT